MIIVNDDLIVIFVEFLLLFKNVFDFEKKNLNLKFKYSYK